MTAPVADTIRRQREASDPDVSAWVSANAGSGKTTVLVERVKRLLLGGVPPGRILCLTFTKAAAANMSNRLLVELAAWVRHSDAELNAALARIEGVSPDGITAPRRAAARRVFAMALETPGGLKIQTIHAFCEALLHQFPFEAGVPASFEVLDDAQTAEIAAGARERVLRRAAGAPQSALGRALAVASSAATEGTIVELLGGALKCREHLAAVLPDPADPAGLRGRIRGRLGLGDPPGEGDLDARILQEAYLPPARWAEAIAILGRSGPSDELRAAALAAAHAATDTQMRARLYEAFFRTADGDFRTKKSLLTKSSRNAAPWLAHALEADLERLIALDTTRRAERIADVSEALLVLARTVEVEIERAKRARGLLDFADLVTRAVALLSSDAAAWVRFKLDRGIDHVLVDEAQDTSAEQWALIDALTQEFFAGEGAAGAARTMFAVGDDKQSIFSFQGAEPALFDRERRRYARAAEGAGHAFRSVDLLVSFRSTDAVLSAVDTVFARAEAGAGVTSADSFPPHVTARRGAPGAVEIWPMIPRPEREEASAWSHPFDELSAQDPRLVLARRIARMIRARLGREDVSDRGRQRPLAAGDVMVLVRTRGPFFEAMIRALKDAGIPVAGADRLVLVEHMAVMDLMALGDAVLLPEDDLTFAAVLKSPLLGLDEEDLLALAAARKEPLVAALAARARERPHWGAAWARFAAWRGRADIDRPFEFFAQVLGADGGRAAIIARLGREAEDALDEFLARALDYEQRHAPTLNGFLAWLRETAVEVKREMEQGRDEVRVMTVHNAKGLEAKLVVLADTTGVPRKTGPWFEIQPETPHAPPLLLWSPSGKADAGPLAAAREAALSLQLAEYRRLLYVAMTRAEDRLIVAGYPTGNAKEPDPGSWYALVRDALVPGAVLETDDAGEPRHLWRAAAAAPRAPAPPDTARRRLRPPWVGPAAAPRLGQRTIAPSRMAEEAPAGSSGSSVRLEARARGVILHRLLQTLPDVPPHRRAEAAERFVSARAPDLTDTVVAEALGVLKLPAFAPFLDAGALSEVPVIGDVELAGGGTIAVAGRIDRLAVSAAAIDILDYKTGAPPADMPDAILTQLALYHAVVLRAHPDRTVRCHVLWTAAPRLDSVPTERLDAALRGLARR
jgi:ATP-dependent helicase/nuclease subunit A